MQFSQAQRGVPDWSIPGIWAHGLLLPSSGPGGSSHTAPPRQPQHSKTASLCNSFIFIPQLLFTETYTYNHCWESIGKLIIVKGLHESNCSVSSELPILILLWEGIMERNGTLETGKNRYQNNLTNANTAPSTNRSVESKSTARCSLWIQLCRWRALCPLLQSLSWICPDSLGQGQPHPAHVGPPWPSWPCPSECLAQSMAGTCPSWCQPEQSWHWHTPSEAPENRHC